MYLDFKENNVDPIRSVLSDGWTSHSSLIFLLRSFTFFPSSISSASELLLVFMSISCCFHPLAQADLLSY